MWELTEKGKKYKEKLMDGLFPPGDPILFGGRPRYLDMRALQALDDIDRTGSTDLKGTLESFWYSGYVEKVGG